MPITIRKGGVPLTTVQGTKPSPAALAPVATRAAPSTAPRPQAASQRPAAPPEPQRQPEPQRTAAAAPAGPHAAHGIIPQCPIDTTVSAATLAKWQKVPPPNAKPKACAYCGQHYIRPCSEVEKVGCSNYAYARQYGMRKEPAHGVA